MLTTASSTGFELRLLKFASTTLLRCDSADWDFSRTRNAPAFSGPAWKLRQTWRRLRAKSTRDLRNWGFRAKQRNSRLISRWRALIRPEFPMDSARLRKRIWRESSAPLAPGNFTCLRARHGPVARNTRACHPSPSRLRSEEHTSELQSLRHLVCRLLLE